MLNLLSLALLFWTFLSVLGSGSLGWAGAQSSFVFYIALSVIPTMLAIAVNGIEARK